MNRQLGLYESRSDDDGGGLGLLASVLVHTIIITLILINSPMEPVVEEEPLTYVELAETVPQAVQQQRRPEIIEAPGPEISQPPPRSAPLSDADRRASIPRPSGPERTDRPGLADAPFVPGSPAPGQQSRSQDATRPEAERSQNENADAREADGLRFEEATPSSEVPEIDWSSAIQEAGKIASLGGQDLGTWGGDEGFAESGPISFETQWYEWGDYATSMIRKIRYHWYNNMPALVRMGVKGVVVIRFTIERDGTITDITQLQSSSHPPLDFAAKKAIQLSSPLRPLPSDFPKATERVTVAFYYNLRPPRG